MLDQYMLPGCELGCADPWPVAQMEIPAKFSLSPPELEMIGLAYVDSSVAPAVDTP